MGVKLALLVLNAFYIWRKQEEQMNLCGLTSLIGEIPVYCKLRDDLSCQEGEHRAVLIEAVKPYLAAALHKDLQLPMLIILSSPEAAKRFYDELPIWCDEQVQVMLYSEPDALPYESLALDPFKEQQRLQVLATLYSGLKQAGGGPTIVVSPAAAVIRKTISPDEFADFFHTLSVGMHVDSRELLRKWNRWVW